MNDQEQKLHAELDHEAVGIMRECAREGLGFNCTFVDDDMNVMVGLAQRAVLAGLVNDINPATQKRLREAAEKHRLAHEAALGYRISNVKEPTQHEAENTTTD